MSNAQTQGDATLEDLMKIDGSAELIDGRIVAMSPIGFWPGRVASRIVTSLTDGPEQAGLGVAVGDPVAYAVAHLPMPSGRQSFCPDASFFTGPHPGRLMTHIIGVPVFAAEVPSENDFGPGKGRAMSLKREDYFAAGTLIVWDVDPVNDIIRSYRHDDPNDPREFRHGGTAEAEPAVPGWTLNVDTLFA